VDMPEKRATSSDVKEHAKSGLNTLQQGVTLRAYAVTTVPEWAFTLTYRCVAHVNGPAGLATLGAYREEPDKSLLGYG
jgi:hypothetical protein